MVSVKKRIIGNREYYYLEHSFREGSLIKKKELYLGAKVPGNIENIKKSFIDEIDREKWYKVLDYIKQEFSKEANATPASDKLKEMESFMIKFTYDTQRIEGSKLTLRETANLLDKGIGPKEKPVRDAKEAEAHKKVFYEMLNCKKNLTMSLILHWHRELFISTKQDIAGKIRAHGVSISGSRFTPPFPSEINSLLDEFFRWYNNSKYKMHPVELSAMVHLKFVTIHPFGDGNGRISRLMMNFILHKFNYPLLDITYENRASYYNALERSQRKNNERIFAQWFIKRYIKENKKYLKSY
ncbi:Fic family protein [Candidatus Woesearchaeota archaeon]|nr:Fic family protein [Candidatus Woesearchaeota archaeon]